MKNVILKLNDELDANDGIIPNNWLPWIDLIKLLLKMAKIFTNDEIDLIIDKILAAIELAETI